MSIAEFGNIMPVHGEVLSLIGWRLGRGESMVIEAEAERLEKMRTGHVELVRMTTRLTICRRHGRSVTRAVVRMHRRMVPPKCASSRTRTRGGECPRRVVLPLNHRTRGTAGRTWKVSQPRLLKPLANRVAPPVGRLEARLAVGADQLKPAPFEHGPLGFGDDC